MSPDLRAGYELVQVGWLTPTDDDEDDPLELPAHALGWTRHVDHGACVPLYIIKEKADA